MTARKVVRVARRRVERLRDVAERDPLALHELRIAYKELRYAVEMAEQFRSPNRT